MYLDLDTAENIIVWVFETFKTFALAQYLGPYYVNTVSVLKLFLTLTSQILNSNLNLCKQNMSHLW